MLIQIKQNSWKNKAEIEGPCTLFTDITCSCITNNILVQNFNLAKIINWILFKWKKHAYWYFWKEFNNCTLLMLTYGIFKWGPCFLFLFESSGWIWLNLLLRHLWDARHDCRILGSLSRTHLPTNLPIFLYAHFQQFSPPHAR